MWSKPHIDKYIFSFYCLYLTRVSYCDIRHVVKIDSSDTSGESTRSNYQKSIEKTFLHQVKLKI